MERDDGKAAVGKSRDRKNLSVKPSYDEGQTWPVSKLLCPGLSAYSSLARLPNGEAGIVYERDGYKKLSFARLTRAWLGEGKD